MRQETYGEDLGQNSWLTGAEARRILTWLSPRSGWRVLEVGCGSGGYAAYLAQHAPCTVVGIDLNPKAVAVATANAHRLGLEARLSFHAVDASRELPFDTPSFDAIVCIDSINHLPDRAAVFREWHRLLRPKGRVAFTDPVVLKGLVSNDELAARSSIGYCVFAPPGENERLLAEAGFHLAAAEDWTESLLSVAERWREARERHRLELLKLEAAAAYAAFQEFLATVHRLAERGRLSRMAYLATA